MKYEQKSFKHDLVNKGEIIKPKLDIEFNAHDTFFKLLSSGTLKAKRLENKKIEKLLEANTSESLNWIAKIS